MARSHASFYVRAWRDDEWTNLTLEAQWLYWALLTQPKLTLVGSLETTPARWASLSRGTDKRRVQAAFDELVVTGKVLVDDATDELLIRSFTKNDLHPNRVNSNLAKGLWGQWACIQSHRLRIAAIDGMPDDLWDKLGQYAPEDAVDIRRSARLEPEEPAPVGTGDASPGSDVRFEPPLSSHLPPDTSRPPAAPTSNPQARSLEQQAIDAANRLGFELVEGGAA